MAKEAGECSAAQARGGWRGRGGVSERGGLVRGLGREGPEVGVAGGRGVTRPLNDSFLPVTIIASAIHAGSYNSRSLPFCGKLRLTACQLEALGGGGAAVAAAAVG